jgi:cytochrome c oxidase subunit 3
MSPSAMTLPPEDRATRVSTSLGMALFIGSWSMAFATLFLSFMILRHRLPAWPPAGVVLPFSSLLLQRAVARVRRGAPGFARVWAAGLVLALVFAALQTRLWFDVWNAGGRPDSGVYESLFYMLTWFHALHVACGLAALLVVQVGAGLGRYGPHRRAPVAAVAVFWHFVDAVWLLLFLGFFVL